MIAAQIIVNNSRWKNSTQCRPCSASTTHIFGVRRESGKDFSDTETKCLFLRPYMSCLYIRRQDVLSNRSSAAAQGRFWAGFISISSSSSIQKKHQYDLSFNLLQTKEICLFSILSRILLARLEQSARFSSSPFPSRA